MLAVAKQEHQAGDEALVAVAHALTQATRKSDFLARYGGDEFVVLMPETTPTLAIGAVDRIRANLVKRKVKGADYPKE